MARELSPNTVKVVDALNANVVGETLDTGSQWLWRFYAEPGQSRDRVVYQRALVRKGEQPNWDREQRFVRCFVERANGGRILYAASWTTPKKWGSEVASEFSVDEADLYAKFTNEHGWGYKGDRKKWEDRTNA